MRSGVSARGRRGGMGSHSRPNQGDSDEWYTPPGIFVALGLMFDLDPCSPPGGLEWVPAARHYSEIEDGLSQPWEGRVWLNPPYGRHTKAWMRRLAAHGDGVALVFARTETEWWHEVIPAADAVTFINGRLTFVDRDCKAGKFNAGAPSVLVAYGRDNAEAIAQSRLGMTFAVRARDLDGQAQLWEAPRVE